MSSTIIQSRKYFKLTDGTNEVYLLGKISEDTNVTPKKFNTFSFYGICFENRNSAKNELVENTNSMLGGSYLLKDKQSEPLTIQAKTAFDRFSNAIDRAIEVRVEKIETISDKTKITWGDEAIKKIESLFENTKISIGYGIPNLLKNYKNEENQEDIFNQLNDFYSKDTISKKDVLGIIESIPEMGQYINHTKEILNPDETAYFIAHSSTYGVNEIKHEKITDKDTIEYLLKNQKSDYLNFSVYDFMDKKMIDEFATPEIIEKNPRILAKVSMPKFHDLMDKQDVFEAIIKSDSPQYIESMASNILSKKENALMAVNKEAYTLKFFTKELKDDNDVVNAALNQNIRAIEHVSDRIKDDKAIALNIVKQNGWLLKEFSPNVKDDNNIALEAIKQNSRTISNTSPRIQELCKDKDPIETLKITILHEELQKDLSKPKESSLDFARKLSQECKEHVQAKTQAMEQSKPKARMKI